ncbi:hypothetical protein NUACC21_40250 [Scytonema sp. NUACC21]
MATKNSRVSITLSPELFEQLEQFCTERQITNSEAIKIILGEYFGALPSTSVSEANTTDLEARLKSLEEKLNAVDELAQRLSALEGSLSEIQERNSAPPNVAYTSDLPVDQNGSIPEIQPETSKQPDNDTIPQMRSQTLNKLAERLGVAKTTVSRNKNREDFREWSRVRDPEGIAWQFHPEELLFYSVQE